MKLNNVVVSINSCSENTVNVKYCKMVYRLRIRISAYPQLRNNSKIKDEYIILPVDIKITCE